MTEPIDTRGLPEASHRRFNSRTDLWWADVSRMVDGRTHTLSIHVATGDVHPARMYVRTTLTEDTMTVELIDNHGQVRASESKIIRASAEPENQQTLQELIDLIDLIDSAGSAQDAAKVILDAGWQPPEERDYDDD